MESEIGCMCDKCNCEKNVFVVISICDSCLHGNHIHKNNVEFREN